MKGQEIKDNMIKKVEEEKISWKDMYEKPNEIDMTLKMVKELSPIDICDCAFALAKCDENCERFIAIKTIIQSLETVQKIPEVLGELENLIKDSRKNKAWNVAKDDNYETYGYDCYISAYTIAQKLIKEKLCV